MKKTILLLNVLMFVFCNNQTKEINPEIEIYDKSIETIIDVHSYLKSF